MNIKTSRTSILPPSAIGLIGGGQLGRMTALAARSAGYAVHAMDPDRNCAIRPVSDKFVVAGWNDTEEATALARDAEVVSFEIEKVSVAVLQAAAQFAPVRPGPEVLQVVQNRRRQKQWLQKNGFPVGPFRHAETAEQARDAVEAFGASFFKVAEGGYDGRGQLRILEPSTAEHAWQELGRREIIVEQSLDLQYELSVLVARRPNGEVCVYPPALNRHENQILSWSVLPAPVDSRTVAAAQGIAHELATVLHLEGLLTVEMFVTNDEHLLVNELAPRTHNSYHASERACVTGQFEQLVRSICNLPLGSAEVVRPTAIVNLLGDLWGQSMLPNLEAALTVPETKFHLYGKSPARAGRKMGHLSSTGRNPEEALRHALLAKERLVQSVEPAEQYR